MSHSVQIPDDLYARFAAYADRQGKEPQALVIELVREVADSLPDGANAVYDPALDPLAEFLGTGELIDLAAVRQHDRVLAEEASDAHTP